MKRIVVLGGSGFVGRSLCEQMVAHPVLASSSILVPTRHRERAKHLLPLPSVHVVESVAENEAVLSHMLRQADAVINLVAILHGTPIDFDRAHVIVPRRVVALCQRHQVQRVIHVSALGVPQPGETAPSHYLRSKAEGEQVWMQSGLDVTILRPSVIFGEHDHFLNLFARLQSLLPVMPLAGAQARFQPVWVEDVARAIITCLLDSRTIGHIYECAGPKTYSLAELVQLAGRWSGHARRIVPLPRWAGRVQAAVLNCLPGEPLMSADNLDSMKVANVATGKWPGLQDLGITPTELEAIAPAYLGREIAWASKRDAWRAKAGR